MGVDDEAGTAGSVVFKVWADGTKLYDSGVMTGTTATESVSVSLTGKTELALIVTDGGDGNGSDHVDGANARHRRLGHHRRHGCAADRDARHCDRDSGPGHCHAGLADGGTAGYGAPQITAVTADNIRSDRARITWRANEGSTRQLEDGTATAYGQQTTLDPTLTLNCSVQLRNLPRGTTYHYRATSQDAAGNVAVSGDFTFTTTP